MERFEEGAIISDPEEKSSLMGTCWEKQFHPNQGPEFINANTRRVNNWYRGIKDQLQHDIIIDLSKLDDSHPIFRTITQVEFQAVMSSTADKAPGKDGIRMKQLKALPSNYIKAIIAVNNSSLASKYFLKCSKIICMIFINKPLKDPYNYRPISLLNILGKLFEKIIAQRYLYFLEHHNVLADLQFGFRRGHSTHHPLFLLSNAIQHYSQEKLLTIVATRDVQKAFDTVWWRGLLYKVSSLPGD